MKIVDGETAKNEVKRLISLKHGNRMMVFFDHNSNEPTLRCGRKFHFRLYVDCQTNRGPGIASCFLNPGRL
jgi:hypothetical protein